MGIDIKRKAYIIKQIPGCCPVRCQVQPRVTGRRARENNESDTPFITTGRFGPSEQPIWAWSFAHFIFRASSMDWSASAVHAIQP